MGGGVRGGEGTGKRRMGSGEGDEWGKGEKGGQGRG